MDKDQLERKAEQLQTQNNALYTLIGQLYARNTALESALRHLRLKEQENKPDSGLHKPKT